MRSYQDKSRLDLLGWAERLRRLHEEQRHSARWNEVQGLVDAARSARGFTLIELMVVMSLIVILASIGLALYGNSVIRAKESVLKEDLFRMRDAIDQYYADKGEYPASLDSLVSEKYLRTIPVDPVHEFGGHVAGHPVGARPDQRDGGSQGCTTCEAGRTNRRSTAPTIRTGTDGGRT